ncbi:FHF complex subunit HOOK interacting protein 2A-like isoform X2 [Rhinoraja longicauda]
MVDILVYEEKQSESGETGPCMEYFLQHKILETLCTLAKAGYPPGMKQQVLVLVTKLLGQIQQPLLPHVNVHRPVQKLICLCGGEPASNTEKEEVHFLTTVCVKLKQDPYLMNFFTEKKNFAESKRSLSCSSEKREGEQQEADSTQASRLSLAAGASPSHTDQPVTCRSPKDKGTQLEKNLLHAVLIHTSSQEKRLALKACDGLLLLVTLPEDVTARYLVEGTALCQTLADRLAHLYRRIPEDTDPGLVELLGRVNWRLHNAAASDGADAESFPGRGDVVAFLSCLHYCDQLVAEAHKVTAAALARQIRTRFFHKVLEPQLLQVMASLRFFEQLLQKSHEHIIYNLVLRNLSDRHYVAHNSGPEETAADSELLDQAEEVEDDPFFTDIYVGSRFPATDWLVAPATTQAAAKANGKPRVNRIVHSFLCLVPDAVKTSHLVAGSGYDTYLVDAHRSFQGCCTRAAAWSRPQHPGPQERCRAAADFYEGDFLRMLLDRMAQILHQPYDLNLQITSVISEVALFPDPQLDEYLLDPYVTLGPGCRSLFSVIVRVIGDLMQRIQRIPEFEAKLLLVRKQLMGLEPEDMVDHATMLKGVIILEEFCKELAAISFVKYSPEPD